MTEKSIWHIVKDCAKGIGMPKLAPHDLRRTASPPFPMPACCTGVDDYAEAGRIIDFYWYESPTQTFGLWFRHGSTEHRVT
jgi:hypothetical protein